MQKEIKSTTGKEGGYQTAQDRFHTGHYVDVLMVLQPQICKYRAILTSHTLVLNVITLPRSRLCLFETGHSYYSLNARVRLLLLQWLRHKEVLRLCRGWWGVEAQTLSVQSERFRKTQWPRSHRQLRVWIRGPYESSPGLNSSQVEQE